MLLEQLRVVNRANTEIQHTGTFFAHHSVVTECA